MKPGPHKSSRLPVAPFLRYARHSSILELARALDVHPWVVHRAVREGLTVHMADRWACKVGVHPTFIWGDDFWITERVA